eukprot:780880-Pyramimonas_sp.AAC.1
MQRRRRRCFAEVCVRNWGSESSRIDDASAIAAKSSEPIYPDLILEALNMFGNVQPLGALAGPHDTVSKAAREERTVRGKGYSGVLWAFGGYGG